MKRAALLVSIALLAGCGGSSGKQTLLTDGPWNVVLDHGKAQALYNGKPAPSAGLKVEILGPNPGQVAPNPPQVAIAMHAKSALVDYLLWVDGNRLLTKGGGSSTNYTIYGAPNALPAGTHTAVGFARTGTSAVAVAWTFRES